MRNKLLLLALPLLFGLQASAQHTQAFQDTTLTDEQRVEHLLSILTLDEKINLLSTDLGVPRLNIPRCGHYEGLHGLTLGGPAMWGGRQRTEDGKVVPTDCPTTIFPQSYGLGSTWDTDLVQKVAEQAAEEARYYMQTTGNKRHALVMRAPNADLARDPRWGRTEESFGEDAFLTAQLTIASVRGLQGNHPRYWKTASLMKHFLANSNEDGRDSTSSDFDTRLFHEYYAYPFYKGITEGGSRAFMAAYNSWNGIPMSIHPCLEEITRKQWGNNGIICTDGGALKLLIEAHKSFPSFAEGAAAVVKATTGQFLDAYVPYVKEALEKGLLTEADIDKACRRILEAKYKLGLFANPYKYCDVKRAEKEVFTPEHRSIARQIATETFVLLKNQDNLLPLQRKGNIALIGPLANTRANMPGTWSVAATADRYSTLLEGFKNAVGSKANILYAQGSNLMYDADYQTRATMFGRELPRGNDQELLDEALKVAAQADVIVAALGESSEMSGESSSRSELEMPDAQ